MRTFANRPTFGSPLPRRSPIGALIAAVLMSATNYALADTIITVKPELSLQSDGKAIIVNAGQYCSDATPRSQPHASLCFWDESTAVRVTRQLDQPQ